MSKGNIILDSIPARCVSCSCYDSFTVRGDTGFCLIKNRNVENGDKFGRPDWCPIKEMPNKKSEFEMDILEHESFDFGKRAGWNECIDELLREGK